MANGLENFGALGLEDQIKALSGMQAQRLQSQQDEIQRRKNELELARQQAPAVNPMFLPLAAAADVVSGGKGQLSGLASALQGQESQRQALLSRLENSIANQEQALGSAQTGFLGSLLRQRLGEKTLESKERQAGLKEGQKQPKESEFKAAGFFQRTSEANNILNDVEANYDLTSRDASFQRSGLGKVSEFIGVNERPEEIKRADQAERNFINAVLRRESGAVISDEEFANAELQYFPRFGDTEEVKSQKRKNRQQVINTLQAEGGRALDKLKETDPFLAKYSGTKKSPGSDRKAALIKAIRAKRGQ